jgi:nitrite reductase/ring-hydroxylating ferredoxin subunit
VDYRVTVPPRSTGKDRARKHAAANLSAVVLFAAAWWVRGRAVSPPGAADLVLEAIGIGLLTAGAWMGGTLVSRNQISVDHRYAGAGKWREQHARPAPGGAVAVGRADELQLNQMKLVHWEGKRIVVARTEEGYVAFEDRCPHRGGSLADGVMICGTVQCPWHGSQFDAATGAVRAGPAEEPIRAYRVERSGDELRLLP